MSGNPGQHLPFGTETSRDPGLFPTFTLNSLRPPLVLRRSAQGLPSRFLMYIR